MNSWYLVVLIFLPVVGALVLAAMSGAPEKTVKLIALVFSLAELAVVVALWMSYRAATTDAASQLDVPFRRPSRSPGSRTSASTSASAWTASR